MTENNAAQPGLTDDEIDQHLDAILRAAGSRLQHYSLPKYRKDMRTAARAIESALLSKLRAEGVQAGDERAAFEAWLTGAYPDAYSEPEAMRLWHHEHVAALAREERARRAALARAPVAGEAMPARHPDGVLSMDGASLHMQRDGSAQIIVTEDDFTLEDDRSEGPDGPQGSVHWVARLPASELIALRDFLTGHDRPSDDALWDQTLSERDEYHDMADKLANAIADHLLVEIGEHSSSNCPWMRALEAIENAAPQASEAVPVGIINAARYAGFTFLRHADGSYTLQPIVMATAQADKDGGDCAKGAGEDLLDYAMAIAHERELDVLGHKHNSDEAVGRFKAAVERAHSPTPSVVKQSLTATQTGEKGESDGDR